MKSISLFSGAGGMDVGFRSAGFEVVWANDKDRDACTTYELNHGPHIRSGDIDSLLPELGAAVENMPIACVFGGPPCQGFSVAGKMDADDPRSELIWSFMKVVELTRPAAFVMENVKALGVLEKFRAIRERLFRDAIRMGYDVDLVVLNAKEYGVPQGRERMFFVGFKNNKNTFREVIHYEKSVPMPLRQTLLSVGKIGSKTNSRICTAKVTAAAIPILRKSPYAGMLFNGQGRPLNLAGYSTTLPASMGGNRTPIIDDLALYDDIEPWVEGYHSALIAGKSPVNWKTVPSRLRRLTIDEAMAIQTFDPTYNFAGTQSSIFKQIGNAVPCRLAQAVATAVYKIIKGHAFNSKDTKHFQQYLLV